MEIISLSEKGINRFDVLRKDEHSKEFNGYQNLSLH